MVLTRLKKRSEFLQAAASGVVAKSQTVIVQCLPVKKEDGAAEVRVGFTASKRVGNAVCRNRAKRRLRAWVDQHLNKKIPEDTVMSYDFVFIALRATGDAEFSKLSFDLEQSVKRCLQQVPC